MVTSRTQPVTFLRNSSVGLWFKFFQICVEQDGDKHTKHMNDFTDDILRIRGKVYLCAFGALIS